MDPRSTIRDENGGRPVPDGNDLRVVGRRNWHSYDADESRSAEWFFGMGGALYGIRDASGESERPRHVEARPRTASVAAAQPEARRRSPAQRAAPLTARPRATDVNSSPVWSRAAPKRDSKIRFTAGTNDVPPVRNTRSTSDADTPVDSSSPSTHASMRPKSSAIHASNSTRVTSASSASTPS